MNVGLLGTGLMGYPMAGRLLSQGHKVWVYNRTPAKALPLKDQGAVIARDGSEVISAAGFIILMLADAAAIRDVLFKTKGSFEGRTIIQMGTISPRESQELSEEVIRRKGCYLECPVLGSKAEAQAGELILMAGGVVGDFENCRELLKCLGPEPRFVGPVGSAAALKLALNQLIASLAAAFALSLGFVERQRVPVELFMTVLRESTLYAPMFDKKLPRWLKRDYENPNFSVKHLLKDINLFLKEAESRGLDASSLKGVKNVVEAVRSGPLVDKDYTALYQIINPPPSDRS